MTYDFPRGAKNYRVDSPVKQQIKKIWPNHTFFYLVIAEEDFLIHNHKTDVQHVPASDVCSGIDQMGIWVYVYVSK